MQCVVAVQQERYCHYSRYIATLIASHSKCSIFSGINKHGWPLLRHSNFHKCCKKWGMKPWMHVRWLRIYYLKTSSSWAALPMLDDQKICLKSRHRWDGLTLNLLFINFPSLSISAAITSIIHPIPDWYQNWEISRRWSIFLIQNKIIWGMWMYRTFSVKKCGVIIPFKIFWSFVREEYSLNFGVQPFPSFIDCL